MMFVSIKKKRDFFLQNVHIYSMLFAVIIILILSL